MGEEIVLIVEEGVGGGAYYELLTAEGTEFADGVQAGHDWHL